MLSRSELESLAGVIPGQGVAPASLEVKPTTAGQWQFESPPGELETARCLTLSQQLIAAWQQVCPALRTQWAHLIWLGPRVTRLRHLMLRPDDPAVPAWRSLSAFSSLTHRIRGVSIHPEIAGSLVQAALGQVQSAAADTEPQHWGPLEWRLLQRLMERWFEFAWPAPGRGQHPADGAIPTVSPQPFSWQMQPINEPTDWLRHTANTDYFRWGAETEICELELAISGHSECAFRIMLSRHETRGTSGDGITPVPPAAPASSATTHDAKACLEPVTLSRADYDNWQLGDILLLGGAAGHCQIVIDGQQRFTGTLGRHGEHKAVRITPDLPPET